MKAKTPFLLTLLLFSYSASFSQNKIVYLSSGNIQPVANINQAVIDSFNSHAVRYNNRAFALLQFELIPTPQIKARLSGSGIELLEYIPDNTYTASINGNLNLAVLQTAGARALFQLSATQKMESRLNGVIPNWAIKIAGTVDVWISFPQTFSQQQVIENLKLLNVDVLSTKIVAYRIMSLRIAQNRIKEIASLPFVEYIQLAPAGDQVLNFNSRYASRATLLNASIADGGKALKGEGVVIGVGDNADVQTHIDFSRRLINRAAAPSAGHGHHVTGTVGGAGNGNDFYRGFAPKATIVSQVFNGVLLNAPTYVSDYGMVITNNSYGDNIECTYYGTYDLYSKWMDQMAIDFPNLSNVFASGNSGSANCAPFQPFYHTVLGGYQSAKNVITVGATTDTGYIAGFSSRGPVRDGRIKPEIVAQGQLVASTWPINIYSYNNGTSMASPAVAGGLGLLYQRYRQLNGGANPKNGLMKALLCNGAADRGNTGPDYQYGYGWMNLLRSLDMMETNHYFTGSSTIGSTINHTINVPVNTAQLKVLLYWNDPAASPLAAKTLVNDLDLEVSSGANTLLPKILDTANANITNPSVDGADHLNNMEQVIINNPVAGNYTIKVKGTGITQNNSQEYFIAYDAVPVQLKVVSPVGGETMVPAINQYTIAKISWEANGFTSGTVTIQFSPDNGANWTTIATNIDINRLLYSWYVPDVTTTQALVRVTKDGTGETSTSNQFIIMQQPTVTMASNQCEGYININWTAAAGSNDYEVMMLRGDEMQTIATTASLNYVFSGLSKDSVYWVTVRPRIGGKAGRRAPAISRQPNNGSCTGNISDNDLKIDAIVAPVTGRKFTSTQLSNTASIVTRVKNLDDASVAAFDVKYSINGGAFVTETVTTPIAAGASYTHTFAAPVDLSAVGNYNLVVVVRNLIADPVTGNDTAFSIVKHLDNQPLNLTSYFVDNIESAADVSYTRDTTGLDGLPRYDFARTSATSFGRLRTFLNSGMAFSGSKALILDVYRFSTGNTNFLAGTFNLVNYNAATNDLRLDFQFNNHGQQPHANNRVWVRGNDAQPWVEVYNLSSSQNDPGSYKKSESIELSDWLATNSQNFGTSFQVRWGQWGVLPATDNFMAAGYSFDDIRIYQVFNDLQLKSIDAPVMNSCGLTNASVVKISVRNSANTSIANIPVKYRINNGAWASETIASIAGNATIQYSFNTTADLSALGNYSIQAVVDLGADSFKENDTLSAVIVNVPVINAYPHLQNFELGNGYWYADGKNKSWEYGTPSSSKIKGAASGAKAWKTRLQGNYNDKELSYLYSPCYDISGLANPTLSFSLALDLEDCGTSLCDAAWVEYSSDGITWTKLGVSGSGTNWYNQSADHLWSIQNFTRWHVATIPLPTGLNRLRIRFVMNSDPAVNREGVAIDDIHIYDNTNGIYDGVTMMSPVSQVVSGNSWIDFTSSGKLVASVKANNQALGATEVRAYINNAAVRFTSSQYYHDRNITIMPANAVADSVAVRFYFLEKEVDTLMKATGCATCSSPSSAYELGVSKYTDPDKSLENGSIGDNNQGIWTFINSVDVAKVPFDKGYYAEFKVKDFSEFWLNNGGLTGSAPLPVKLMEFTAQKVVNDALLKWKVGAESNVDRYEIELARGNDALQSGIWNKIGEVASLGNTTSPRNYQFTDIEADKFGPRHYRIKTVNLNGSFVYSPVRSLVFEDAVLWQTYPNPSKGLFNMVYQLNSNESMTARVLDAKGSLVKEYQRTGNGQLQKFSIDLTLQAAGVYLLELNVGEKKRVMKLYKQ